MEMTTEQIEKAYSAALDSVNLINSEKPVSVSEEEWADILKRNKEHLEIILEKDFWTTEDLAPLKEAIEADN